MVLIIKMFKNIYGKKYVHKIINKFKYFLSAHRVIVIHNAVN
jgi:hypothetical protein